MNRKDRVRTRAASVARISDLALIVWFRIATVAILTAISGMPPRHWAQ
jgi:hypothetical protein